MRFLALGLLDAYSLVLSKGFFILMSSDFSIPDAIMQEPSSLLSREEQIQEGAVARFASLLSGSGSRRDILQYVSTAVSPNDVVCTIPSLDMQSVSAEASPLPQVGEHRERSSSKTIPEMKATVILNQAAGDESTNSPDEEKGKQDEAAQALASPTSWTKSSLAYATDAASKNISSSFQSLVDARVRAWTLLLLKHSLSTGDSTSRSRLLGLLSFNVELNNTKTSFTALPLPDEARSQPKEADVILPLLFETELTISMNGKEDTIAFQAPGTISGDFCKDVSKLGLTKVEVRLDCASLLESMVEQARLVTFRAVARATSSVVSPNRIHATSLSKPSATTLAGPFTSVLSLSEEATAGSPTLQKARTSALRLNTILEGKAPTPHGGEDTLSPLLHKSSRGKNLSVTWDPAAVSKGANPSPKRQCMANKKGLQSMKSFGRAHAGDGYDGRNATFGDFGRTPLAAGPVWGKDGRLKNHPVPGGGLMSGRLMPDAEQSKGGVNATFDLQRPAARPSAAVEALLNSASSSSKPSSSSNSTGSAAALPRTATALENWLVDATKSKGIP